MIDFQNSRSTRLLTLALAAVCVVRCSSFSEPNASFRGRWWSYYERGRSHADEGHWKEAEDDLRTAMASRSDDQYWARTYGLHFAQEYFPHRELGVVLYNQERLAEAIGELETSLQQRFSARAAYYLDRARARKVNEGQLDREPPEIILDDQASAVAESRYTVSGVASDDTYVKSVAVNGNPVLLNVTSPHLSFSQDVVLAPGENAVSIVVEDIAGRRAESSAIIFVDTDGPAVSFASPVVVPGVITGYAADGAGVDCIQIGGKAATLNEEADGTVSFEVQLDSVPLSSPLAFEAKDSFGNTTRGLVPVETVILSQMPSVGCVAPAGSPGCIALGNGLVLWCLGEQPVAISRSESELENNAPRVRLTNLSEGQMYRLDEIVVDVDITSDSPVARAELNGHELAIIPGRGSQRLSRRVPLQPGLNRISAGVVDCQGRKSDVVINVERQLTEIERVSNRLSVAFVGSLRRGSLTESDKDTDFLMESFERELQSMQRFSFVNRDLLPQILDEQQLANALGDKDKRLALGKIMPAEMMLIGQVRRDTESWELIVQAISTETGLVVARADVAGPVGNLDELDRLVKDLALRTVQEFPCVQGQVALIKPNDSFVSNLGQSHGLKESMKCTVFRYGEEIKDPVTGAFLGQDTTIISDALVRSVSSNTSVAECTKSNTPEPGLLAGDYVITK